MIALKGMSVSCRIPFTTSALVESVDRRVVDLSSLGFEEIPVLGMNRTPCATEGSVFHRHRRCMEITLCVRGCAKFDCDGKVYTLKAGMVFASLPEDVHRLRMNQRGARLYWLFFRLPERGESAFGLPSEETADLIRELRRLPRKAFAVSDGVRMAFEDLFASYDMSRASRPGRTFWIRVAALKLFSTIIKDGQCDVEDGMDRVFKAIIDQMRRNPEKDYDETWLVTETHLSPNTVLSRFRQMTGLPPHAFLMKCRIHRAKDLLERREKNITEIASELKFSSSQHFATRFRQETGMTPKAWREAHVNKAD